MKTSTVKVEAPAWYVVDATDQSIGRLATRIATVLRGKHKPSFSPHQLCGDHVVVINCTQLNIPTKKLMQKLYHHHTGYTGHLKTRTLSSMMEKNPQEVIELAVKRMLPANRLRPEMMKRLHVFTDDKHTHEAQTPAPFPVK